MLLIITCSPQDPKFMGSNPADVGGFFQDVKILCTSALIMKYMIAVSVSRIIIIIITKSPSWL